MPVMDPGERRLARGGGADHPERLAGLEREVEAAQARLAAARAARRSAPAPRAGRAGGAGRSVSVLLGGGLRAASAGSPSPAGRACTSGQPPIACSTGASARPDQDRAGDHRAGAHLAEQHHVGAEAEHRRLKEEAEGLGQRRELADAVARGELRRRARGSAACCQRASTASRMPSAWIISPCWRMVSAKASPCIVAPVASCLVLAGQQLVEDRDPDEEDHAGEREMAEIGVEAVDRDQEHRRPGHVEDREQHRRAGQLLHRLDVLEAGGRLRALARQHRAAQVRAEHPARRAGAWKVVPIRAATRART